VKLEARGRPRATIARLLAEHASRSQGPGRKSEGKARPPELLTPKGKSRLSIRNRPIKKTRTIETVHSSAASTITSKRPSNGISTNARRSDKKRPRRPRPNDSMKNASARRTVRRAKIDVHDIEPRDKSGMAVQAYKRKKKKGPRALMWVSVKRLSSTGGQCFA